jgi:branched-chain amino acid aminotransferase
MSLVWLNGTLLDTGAARIDPADRGFTLGDGVFETLRAERGTPLHAPRHFARLRNGAAVLAIPVPFRDDAIFDVLCAVLRANDLADAALRLTLSRGPAPRGVLPPAAMAPTMLITAGPLPGYLPPARLIISQRTRRNEFSPLSRIKSLNYLDCILARQEAEASGADDALLLNTQGDIAEASAACVFLYIDGSWVTPRVADGALPGIARGRLLEAAQATETRVRVTDLRRAEAGFLANALACRVLRSVDSVAFDVAHNALREMQFTRR